ncbi:hypothetical protein CP532_0461 [Ophiocordyceps camponoti-leonardi (nom. inval.)]|nr:hypothetical protein CP532_0461 [Ophiocordyceps camponoti-leonardi (nom. inval.)]
MTPESNNLLLSRMTSSLPPLPNNDNDNTSTPKIILQTAPDAVALLVNALLQAQGFILTRVGEQDASTPSSSSSSSTEIPSGSRLLPTAWSASQPFFYSHPSLSDLGFTVKVDSLGPRLDVRVFAEGKTEAAKKKASILRLEWEMDDLVRKDGLPVRVDDRRLVSSKLQRAFVSDEAVAHQDDVVFPPHPPPLTAFPPPTSTTDEFQPPGFDDELDLTRPPRNLVLPDGRSPFSIGHDDLYPAGLGPRDPLRPSFGPPSAGMHPTFDDPLFGPNPGPDGFDPQIPPGARWDPVGPGAGPRFPPPHGGRRNPFGPGGNSFGPGGVGGGGII